MQVEVRDGRLELSADPDLAIHVRGLRPEVVYWHGGSRQVYRPALRPVPGGAESMESEDGLYLHLAWEKHGSGFLLHCRLRNRGSSSIQLSRLAPFQMRNAADCRVGARARDWSVFRQGYQSWTGTRSFRADETDRDPWSALLQVGLIDVRHPSTESAGHFRSDMLAAIHNLLAHETLLVGFVSCRRAFGGVEVGIDGDTCTHFAAALDYDEVDIDPGEEVVTDALWIAAGTDALALLDEYAQISGAAMQARVPERNPTGWCSWYYYFTAITEPTILENLQELGKMRERFACDYVQVDDGYQAQIGDWLTPNAKFPHGMKWLAEQIRNAGFDAGVWTAPFIARSGSRLLSEHPDWFVRNESGGPRFALWNPLWGFGGCYALDTTHPEALEWLRQTFRTIAHDWGYRVLKLDFLYAAALPGRRYDRKATRAEALRRGLEVIREAAGDQAFLLGCGCPLGPAVGIVDAMRIGPDVAPFWTNLLSRTLLRDQHGLATKHAIRNTLTRAFLHRRWWLNDPDCLMVRDTRTQLTVDEVRTLATAIAVTDGMVVVSDRLAQLSPRALDTLQRTLRLAGGRAEVLDLFGSGMPEVVVSRSPAQTLLAVFNFADRPRRKRVDLGALRIHAGSWPYVSDYWTGTSVPIADGVANFGMLPAHASRVLVFPSS